MQPSPSAPALADTEEVTGSNPVSPTSITPGQARFCARWRSDRLTCRPNFVGLSLGVTIEELIDGVPRPACCDWPQFLRYSLRDARTSMADEVGDLLDGCPGA